MKAMLSCFLNGTPYLVGLVATVIICYGAVPGVSSCGLSSRRCRAWDYRRPGPFLPNS